MAVPARPYSCKSLAEHWQCNTQTVRRRIADGSLRAFRVGRDYRIPRAEVAAFEERNATCASSGESLTDDTSTSAERKMAELRRFRRLRKIGPEPNLPSSIS